MIYGLIVIVVVLIVATTYCAILFSSESRKKKAAEKQLIEMKSREIDIQASVEKVKDDMKMVKELSIASDALFQLDKEDIVYRNIASSLETFFHCNQMLIYSFDDEKRVYVKRFCKPVNSGFADTVTYNEKPFITELSPRCLALMVRNSQDKCLYYIKLDGRRELLPDGRYMQSSFTSADINVFNVYIKQSSMILDKIRAYSKMERMALTDNLTGLYNRHYAHMRIREEVKRANREGYPVSIMFVDIDKFKSINDTYGHDVGDLALQHLSAILKSVTREYDVAIRWGGEEFVLFLPNTDESGAMVLAERLRVRIETERFEYCKMTASLGVSSYPRDAQNIEKVISNADSALYHSKQTGRNRTTAYSQIQHMVQ